MNYKLINKQTGEEHICQKMVVDGWDYYVSDGTENRSGKIAFINNEVYKNELRVVTTAFGNDNLKDCKKVIATNNPNTDIPKVVDEVEELADMLFESHSKNIMSPQFETRKMFISGHNKSQETHPFSEEDMIDFAEFYFREEFNSTMQDCKPSKEILQLWREQKPKALYYE